MVRLTGPTQGTQASGSLGNTLTFSSSKRRSYVKFKTSPKQPNTDPQAAIKAYFKGIAGEWHLLNPAQKRQWTDQAAIGNITNYTAYIRWNLHRFRSQLPPKIRPVDWEFPCSATWAAPTATKHWNSITFDWNITALAELWFVLIIRRPGPGPGWQWSNTRGLVHQTAIGTGSWRDNDPRTGTSTYKFYLVSLWGYFSPMQHQVVVVYP